MVAKGRALGKRSPTMLSRDRIVPSNVEAEQAVLGSILLSEESYFDVQLRSEDFYLEKHSIIFETIQKMVMDGQRIDFLTLNSRLETSGKIGEIGGSSYLLALINSVPGAYRIGSYAAEVQKCAARRKLIWAAARISELGYETKEILPEEMLSKAHRILLEIELSQSAEKVKWIYDAITEFIPELQDYLSGTKGSWGVPTGIKDLDVVIGGFPFGEMTLIAADPGKGKTMFVTNAWMNAGIQNYSGIFFSLEMKMRQLMLRLFAERGDLDSNEIRLGRISEAQKGFMFAKVHAIEELPIYVFDSSTDTAGISRTIMRMQLQREIKLAVVDYSDLLTDKAETEVVRQKHISHALKNIAKQTGVALLVVHPITRDASKEKDTPELYHLGWGRAWEYDAHTVLFLHFEKARQDFTAYIKVAKYREGISDKKLTVYFDGKRWKDMNR